LGLTCLLCLFGHDLLGYGSNMHKELPFLVADMPPLKEPVRSMMRNHAAYARIGGLLQDSGNLRRGEIESCTRLDGTLDPVKVVAILRKRRHPVAKIADEIEAWGIAGQWQWMSSHDPVTPEWYADAIHDAIVEGNGKKVAFLCGAVTHLAECLIGYHSRAMAAHGAAGRKLRREIEMAGRAPRIDFHAAQKIAIKSLTKMELGESLEAWYRRYLSERYLKWYPKVLQWRIADEEPGTPEHLKRANELGLFESMHVLKFCVKVFNEAVDGPPKDRYRGADVLVVLQTGLRDGAHLSYLTLMAKNGISYEMCSGHVAPDLSIYKAVIVLAGRYQMGLRVFFTNLAAYIMDGGNAVIVGEPAFGPEGPPGAWLGLKNGGRIKWTRRDVASTYENHVFVTDALRAFWGAGRVATDAAEPPESLRELAIDYKRKLSYRHMEGAIEFSKKNKAGAEICFDFVTGLADCTGGWIDLDGSRTERKIPFDVQELTAREIDGRPIIKTAPGERDVLFESGRRIVLLSKELRLPEGAARIVLSFSYRLTDSRRGTRRLQLLLSRAAGTPTCLLDDRIKGDDTTKAYALDLTKHAGQTVTLEFRLRNVGIYNYVGRSLLVEPVVLTLDAKEHAEPRRAP